MAFTSRGFSVDKALELPLTTRTALFARRPILQLANLILRTKDDLNRPKAVTKTRTGSLISRCSSDSSASAPPFWQSPPLEVAAPAATPSVVATGMTSVPRMIRKRRRYRKQYPGEMKGITEEMRFVAMRLRNVNGKKIEKDDGGGEEDNGDADTDDADDTDESIESVDSGNRGYEETWQPSLEGFLKYLVDSNLVFNTIERIVDESSDVSYVYFRKTGLERSEGLSEDLEWFSNQEIAIPPPSNPGITYAKYLEELAEKNAPLFLCHFYNIYFAHIAGGQVIAKQVSEKLLDGRELQFYSWEADVEESLKGVREKLNMLGEHWSRDDKNKCLREATKSFRYQGQIVRLIIL